MPSQKKSTSVLQIGDPILRKKASELPQTDISSKQIQSLFTHMIKILHKQEGVGLAAPQIGISERVIVIEYSAGTSKRKRKSGFFPLQILVNPVIVDTSSEKEIDWEGCLSVDSGDLLGPVPRFKKVTVKALNEKGKAITIKASDFQARVLQHEIDHLDGILFFDRMRKRDLSKLTTRFYWEKYYQ